MRVILVKKTLLVSAVAAAMAVPAGAYAAASDGLYGRIRLGLQQIGTSPAELGTKESGGLDLVSGKLVFGFKGSSDLDNGMQVSYKVELENDSADSESSGWSNDASYIALSGGFGTFAAGEYGSMAGYACGGTDLLTYGTADACELGLNTSPKNAIHYRGGSGMLEFGVIYITDGELNGDTSSSVGAKFSGESWSVGGQFTDVGLNSGDFSGQSGIVDGESGSQIGATFQLGNIGLGVTVGDNGAVTDSGGVDLGLYMPLGAGNLALVVSTMDTPNSDSADIEYKAPMGGGLSWGVEWNSQDSWADDRITGYLDLNF